MNFPGLIRFFTTLTLIMSCLLAFGAESSRAQQPQPMIEPHAQAMPLLPFLDFYVDEGMNMDIEEVANLSQGWQPMALDRLPLAEGIVWLRFTIAPLAEDARPRTFLLDMGESVPGQPALYDPVHNELSGAREWRENQPAQRNILLLPEAGQEAIPCYIRIDGLPGPWFAPMIRTPQNAASNLSSLARTSGILALAVIMLLCILRGLGEKGQWRYWTALFVCVALAQALLGMPREAQHLSITDLAAVLCPGLALMFLPHVGRHLMQAKKWSRSIDIQLFLLSLPGAALAVLPLAPGWNWLDRFLELWPLGTLLFVPTALGAWMMGIPGSRRFLLACILPPIFVAFALLGMEFGLPANLLAACPIWSVALGALLLVAMRSPLQPVDDQNQKSKKNQGLGKKQLAIDLPDLDGEAEKDIINLDMPIDDPNLRLLPPAKPEFEELDLQDEELLAPKPAPEPNPAIMAMKADEERQLALWKPVDDILREAAALEQCSLPPSAKEAVACMKAAAQRLGFVLSGKKQGAEEKAEPKRRPQTFNLQRILRGAHDSVAALAECSGIALSWYMPPHLGQVYSGDAHALENALRLLLESSIRCSKHGAIKLSARGVPGSADHGHLLFTVSDDGKGYPPHERSSLALAKAWEFAGEYGGYLSVEASDEGATIAFTAHFTPWDMEHNEEERGPVVVLAGTEPGERRQLARIIEALPCRVTETDSAVGALAAQNQQPTGLLVAQGRLARPAAADLVRDFCRIARQNGIQNCHVLAVTTLPEQQWGLLKNSGFTHAMLEPVDPEVLRRTVADLLHLQLDRQNAEPFQPENAALEAPKGQGGEDLAPTMLIDQEFGIKAAFEGPEWLGKPLEKSKCSVVENGHADSSVDGRVDNRVDGASQPRENAPRANASEYQKTERAARPANAVNAAIPANAGADVARPGNAASLQTREFPESGTDVKTKAPQAKVASPKRQEEFASGDMGMQGMDTQPGWEEARASGEKAQMTAWANDGLEDVIEWDLETEQTRNSVTDFIVGAETSKEASVAARPTGVKNFMKESASLVSSTLSNLLAQKEDEVAARQDLTEETTMSAAGTRMENAGRTTGQPVPQPAQSKRMEQATPQAGETQSRGSVFAGESMRASFDPEVLALLDRLDEQKQRASSFCKAGNCKGVAAMTAQMAQDAEAFGLRLLTRLASCVWRAADAGNLEAVNDLLPDLENAVERNRILITQKQGGSAPEQ